MTIEAMMILGFAAGLLGCWAAGLLGCWAAGLLVGFSITRPRLGCTILLAIPIGMIGYVSWWQGQNPDQLRSTSALDFMFGPLWPSLGAIGGYYAGNSLRWLFDKQ